MKKSFLFILGFGVSALVVGCTDDLKTPGMEILEQDVVGQDVYDVDGQTQDAVSDLGQDVRTDLGPIDNGSDLQFDTTGRDPGFDLQTDAAQTDLAIDDVTIQDQAGDPGVPDQGGDDTVNVDAVVYQSMLFRLTRLQDEDPGFVYCSMGSQCMDLTDMVNRLINQYIQGTDGKTPVDILLRFEKSREYQVTIGNGDCERTETGRLKRCRFKNDGSDVTYEDVVYKGPQFSSLCMDDPQVKPACFGTDKQNASIEIPGMGLVLGLKDADVAAHFTGSNPFSSKPIHGYLRVFMPLSWANAILIEYPQYNVRATLDQLLPPEKLTEYKGERGWWFAFSFDASPVRGS